MKKREKTAAKPSALDLRLSFQKPSRGIYFAIPKKAVPLAVERNRLKRYAREEWRKGAFSKRGLFVRALSRGKIRKLKREEFNRAYQKALKALGGGG